MSRTQRTLIGVLAAGTLALPVITATAAPKKKPAKPAPKAAAKADPKAGQALFSKEGCTGCHRTKDFPKGGEIGPDLSEIAKEHKSEEIAAYTKKPKAGSIMPAFKGPQAALDNIVAYLNTQK
jgi:mono/diheme cytochrome c family protein